MPDFFTRHPFGLSLSKPPFDKLRANGSE